MATYSHVYSKHEQQETQVFQYFLWVVYFLSLTPDTGTNRILGDNMAAFLHKTLDLFSSTGIYLSYLWNSDQQLSVAEMNGDIL